MDDDGDVPGRVIDSIPPLVLIFPKLVIETTELKMSSKNRFRRRQGAATRSDGELAATVRPRAAIGSTALWCILVENWIVIILVLGRGP